MIKVVKNKVKEIAVEDLNNSHYIGIQFGSGIRGAVVKTDADEYIVVTTNDNASYDSKVVYKSIEKLVTERYIEDCYVFETAKELFTWVANG